MADNSVLSYQTNEKIELETLTPEQVEIGNELVANRHPLTRTMLWVTLPYLAPIKQWLPKWMPRATKSEHTRA